MYSWKVTCLAVFKSIQGFKVPTEWKVWKWEKWYGSQILKHSHAFLMHVTITTAFASLHSKREAHNCEGQKDRNIWEWICCCLPYVFFECLFFFFFLYICLLKEPGCYVIISIAVMKVRVDIFHIHWYGNVYLMSYVIHTVTSSTCCFWQLGCRCENVHISFT